MELLAEVWRGRFNDSCFYVHLYVLQDGRRYVDAPNPEDWKALEDLTLIAQFSPPNVN